MRQDISSDFSPPKSRRNDGKGGTVMAVGARKICASLWESMCREPRPASLHSAFQHAANLSTSAGMLTLLPPGKGLQPGSAVLEQEIDFSRLGLYSLFVGKDGVFAGGVPLITFHGARRLELRLDDIPQPYGSEGAILDFLSGRRGVGLTCLAFNEVDNPWAEFLSPRLLAFRRAVWSGEPGSACYAVRRIAGCGPGLTPSSDDWLCGYLAALPPPFRHGGTAALLAETAAAATNDISANLLRWAGKGYFSEDILALKRCLCRNGGAAERWAAMERVADFGSSSGCDFLTGFYFGLLDTNSTGGKQLEET